MLHPVGGKRSLLPISYIQPYSSKASERLFRQILNRFLRQHIVACDSALLFAYYRVESDLSPYIYAYLYAILAHEHVPAHSL